MFWIRIRMDPHLILVGWILIPEAKMTHKNINFYSAINLYQHFWSSNTWVWIRIEIMSVSFGLLPLVPDMQRLGHPYHCLSLVQ